MIRSLLSTNHKLWLEIKEMNIIKNLLPHRLERVQEIDAMQDSAYGISHDPSDGGSIDGLGVLLVACCLLLVGLDWSGPEEMTRSPRAWNKICDGVKRSLVPNAPQLSPKSQQRSKRLSPTEE